MNQSEQKRAAKAFVERWGGKGDEKQDAQSFWGDLLVNVLGAPSYVLTGFIDYERRVQAVLSTASMRTPVFLSNKKVRILTS